MVEVLQIFTSELFSHMSKWSNWKILMTAVLMIYMLYRFLKFKTNFDCQSSRNKGEWFESKWKKRYKNVPPVYPNGWYSLLGSDEISTGQVKYVSALSEDFAVFRGEDGKVKIVHAICPHLGANIAIGGTVSGNCVECPFHGWKFDGSSGRCVSIPYSNTTIPAEAKVKTWHSCEANTMIYVWYHAENEAPTWYPELVPKIEDGTWRCRQKKEYRLITHIQDITENGADLTHFSTVHEALPVGALRWTSEWISGKENEKRHTAVMNMEIRYTLLGFSKLITTSSVFQQGPGELIIHINAFFGSLTILNTMTPIEPFVQRVVKRAFYSPFSGILVRLFGFSLVSLMYERDAMLWNNKVYMDKPLLTKEENTIRKYRQWYKQFYSEHSPRFQETNFF